MHLPVSVAYTYTTLFTAIHVSLSLCLSAMYPFKLHNLCTVSDVMVGVIAGKMSWPAVTVRKDSRDVLQKNNVSSILTSFNLSSSTFAFSIILLYKCVT